MNPLNIHMPHASLRLERLIPVLILVVAGHNRCWCPRVEKKRGLAPRRLMDCLLPPSTRHALTIPRMIHILYKHRRPDVEAEKHFVSSIKSQLIPDMVFLRFGILSHRTCV